MREYKMKKRSELNTFSQWIFLSHEIAQRVSSFHLGPKGNSKTNFTGPIKRINQSNKLNQFIAP